MSPNKSLIFGEICWQLQSKKLR